MHLELFTFKRLLVWGMVAAIAVTPLCQIISAFSAGTALRYISDYTMLWTYVVLLAVLQLNFSDSNQHTGSMGVVNFHALSYLAIMAICLVTLVEHSFLVFSGDHNDILFTMQPELWVLLSRIFAPLSVAF